MKHVWVVMGFELGWDNVCGIFDLEEITEEELLKVFPEGKYHIQLKQVEKDLNDW